MESFAVLGQYSSPISDYSLSEMKLSLGTVSFAFLMSLVSSTTVNLLVGVDKVIHQLESSSLRQSELLSETFKMELMGHFDEEDVENEWETLQLPANQQIDISIDPGKVSISGFEAIFQYLVSDPNLQQKLVRMDQTEFMECLSAAQYLGMEAGFYEAIVNSLTFDSYMDLLGNVNAPESRYWLCNANATEFYQSVARDLETIDRFMDISAQLSTFACRSSAVFLANAVMEEFYNNLGSNISLVNFPKALVASAVLGSRQLKHTITLIDDLDSDDRDCGEVFYWMRPHLISSGHVLFFENFLAVASKSCLDSILTRSVPFSSIPENENYYMTEAELRVIMSRRDLLFTYKWRWFTACRIRETVAVSRPSSDWLARLILNVVSDLDIGTINATRSEVDRYIESTISIIRNASLKRQFMEWVYQHIVPGDEVNPNPASSIVVGNPTHWAGVMNYLTHNVHRGNFQWNRVLQDAADAFDAQAVVNTYAGLQSVHKILLFRSLDDTVFALYSKEDYSKAMRFTFEVPISVYDYGVRVEEEPTNGIRVLQSGNYIHNDLHLTSEFGESYLDFGTSPVATAAIEVYT